MITNVADLVMDLRKENARLRGELSELRCNLNAKVEQERKLLIKENGGSSMDVLCYVFYHRVKYSIKVVVNTIKSWIKK